METIRRHDTGQGGTVSKSAPERVFFIVDRSRLKEETDELKDAVVVYVPEGDLKKPSLEQKCSQLIGISLLIFNFTSKLPKFIKLKTHGFAIRPLGDTPCVMGLQSKFDEPKSSVIHYLDRIHDFFMFSYCSLDYVMEMSQGDWEIFTKQMTTIFQSILDFTFRQNHTLPSMFNPLPYVTLDSEKGGSKLFLNAHRLLRNIQLKNSVIGGCLFYNGELLCSQLPPDISEKLLFVSNGGVDLNSRSILDDQEMPESVWIIDIYLAPEELAILHQIQRPHRELTSFYSNLTPTPGLARSVFASSCSNSRSEEIISELLPPAPPPPIYRADSSGSADFVTISYNSVSYSATHSTSIVSPLKRPKSNRRFSHSYEELNRDRLYEELTSSTVEKISHDNHRETSFSESNEIPPPLPPPRPSEAPPLPVRNKGVILPRTDDDEDFDDLPPPPVPPRPGTEAPPPPIPKRNSGPIPPPRSVSKRKEFPPPPPIPLKTQWIQGERGERGEEEDTDNPISPNGVYGTPTASISEALMKNNEMLFLDRRDSEGSDHFGTPSSNSPVQTDLSLSTVTSDPSNTTYLTPLVTSLNSPDTSRLDIYNTLERSFKEGEAEKTNSVEDIEIEPESHLPVQLSGQLGVNTELDRKISATSNASSDLVITKAISEPGSCDSTLLRRLHDLSNEDLSGQKSSHDGEDDHDESDSSPPPFPPPPYHEHKEENGDNKGYGEGYIDREGEEEGEEGDDDTGTFRRISSPHDFTESPSENEDQLGSLVIGAILRQNNIKRPRAESWMGTQGSENEEIMTQRVMWYEKRTIYIQKCVNTVAAIVTDTNLPDDKQLVQDLWKSMLTHLLYINNTVQSCIMEKEELYVTGESVKTEGLPRTYQAVYSGLTGNCEVSSATAPYQFRHAARRAHQEYVMNPSLRQLSLCKEYCRMFCQNTMGRESYIHTNRNIVNDPLATHCALERHAKVLTKQQKRRDPIDYNVTPNLSFI